MRSTEGGVIMDPPGVVATRHVTRRVTQHATRRVTGRVTRLATRSTVRTLVCIRATAMFRTAARIAGVTVE